MFRKTGIEYLTDTGVPGQPLGNLQGVFLLALHAYRQRFYAPQNQPAVKGGKRSAGGFGNHPDALSKIRTCGGQKTGNRIVVAAEEFAAAVQYQVGPQRNGILQIRGEKSVVHDQQKIVFFGDACAFAQIGDVHHGIAGGFYIKRTGILPQKCPHLIYIRRVGKIYRKTVFLADGLQKPGGSAV